MVPLSLGGTTVVLIFVRVVAIPMHAFPPASCLIVVGICHTVVAVGLLRVMTLSLRGRAARLLRWFLWGCRERVAQLAGIEAPFTGIGFSVVKITSAWASIAVWVEKKARHAISGSLTVTRLQQAQLPSHRHILTTCVAPRVVER